MYKKTLDTYVGPTEVLTCGDTLQIDDYNRYNWTIFNPEDKKRRHDETFEEYLSKAYEIGKKL